MTKPQTWIAANWKMNKTPKETRAYFEEWLRVGGESAWEFGPDVSLVFFPPATSIETVAQSRNTKPGFMFGSQNAYFEKSGAYTGEISAEVVRELGGQFVLLGHSERRTLFGEVDAVLAKKVAFVQSLGLTPMYCIGETLAEREAGKTGEVLKRQLKEGLSLAKKDQPLVVAYEPVWAIGTGKVATPEQVKETHAQVRQELEALGLMNISILYGGSVKADNAGALSKIPNVNGFLVGGASLECQSFRAIAMATAAGV